MSQDSLATVCQALIKEGMTAVHVAILCRLDKSNASMTELAGLAGHTTAAATGAIDRLKKLHLVERADDPYDRRKVMASITEKGRCKLANLRQAIR